jgi:hypothetical protein
MIKLPVKDPDTVPWMSRREIPAIKAALSAWRKLRKDEMAVANARDGVLFDERPKVHASIITESVAWQLEKLAAIDERLRREAKNARLS